MCVPLHGLPGDSAVKRLPQCRRPGFRPWVGKTPWRRARQPTPVFLPGKSRGQRSLAGYGPRDHEEPDATAATEHTRTDPFVVSWCGKETNCERLACRGAGESGHALHQALAAAFWVPLLPVLCLHFPH